MTKSDMLVHCCSAAAVAFFLSVVAAGHAAFSGVQTRGVQPALCLHFILPKEHAMDDVERAKDVHRSPEQLRADSLSTIASSNRVKSDDRPSW